MQRNAKEQLWSAVFQAWAQKSPLYLELFLLFIFILSYIDVLSIVLYNKIEICKL